MTVKQLIKELQAIDENKLVIAFCNDLAEMFEVTGVEDIDNEDENNVVIFII